MNENKKKKKAEVKAKHSEENDTLKMRSQVDRIFSVYLEKLYSNKKKKEEANKKKKKDEENVKTAFLYVYYVDYLF